MNSKTPLTGKAIRFDDAKFDPVFEACGRLNMPVNIHVAQPAWMYEKMDSTNDGLMNAFNYRLDDKPNIVDHAGMIRILENTLQRHPKTTFIACHFANCCYDLDAVGKLLDKYSNLYVDIAARFFETAAIPVFTKKFYEKHQDRLLYGTDMGNKKAMYDITFRILETEDEHFYDKYSSYHWYLNGFGLNKKILRKLYFENAEKIISANNRSKKINRSTTSKAVDGY
jgi:predicted TIM-barrel fold metal-dependent hydrolase